MRAINTRENPRRVEKVRKTPSRDIVFVRSKAFKFHSRAPSKSKAPTRTRNSHLGDEKEAKPVQSSRDLKGGDFSFKDEEDIRRLVPDQPPQCLNCR